MEGKTNTAVKDWVESKRVSIPPSGGAVPSTELDPQALQGIPKPGDDILSGKYKVERVIGIGGMGVVVSAVHKQLQHKVAIKLLTATMQTPELVDRFIREGQAAVRIKSEHIATVLDVGVLESGTPYLMMEHLTGADLGEYLAERGAVPMDEAVDFILQACDALAVAHSAGIVHRDLKPSNLFVTQRSDGSPLIKVLDFGISKVSAAVGQPDPKSTLTRPGMMLGSPRYMSPEQLRNASKVDHRADIWAMGIVLQELIVGQPPFDADTFAALCAMIASEAPARLRDARPEAPAELEALILRCVEKNPADRFQNVGELAAALVPFAPDESRVIAQRVGKILGHIPQRTPPGQYVQTKPSPGTPKPHDRTLPIPGGAPNSAPLSSTPMPSVTPMPSITPHHTDSALAVSNAKPKQSGSTKILAALGLFVFVAAAAFVLTWGRKTKPPAETVAATSAAAATATPAASTTAPPPEPTPTQVTTAEPPPPAVSSHAAVSSPPVVAPVGLSNRNPRVPGARASASSAATPAASPPPTASPTPAPAAPAPAPNEADMLNRRR